VVSSGTAPEIVGTSGYNNAAKQKNVITMNFRRIEN
jgi:hypothetical protein